MRIISGECRGRNLVQIEGRDIRPTSDRVREALFNILGTRIKKARVLDLFAGTGALGLEALSRGASHGVFMDKSESACQAIRKNLDLCRMADRAELIRRDIASDPFPHPIAPKPFDLVFMDPPYDRDFVAMAFKKIPFDRILSARGILVVEHSLKESIPQGLNRLDIFREKKYSRTRISFLTRIID